METRTLNVLNKKMSNIFTVRKGSCRKVMLLHLSVILFTEGHAWWWDGVCVAGGHAWRGGGHVWQGEACMAGEMATAVDGTHPTGMHSCRSCRCKPLFYRKVH